MLHNTRNGGGPKFPGDNKCSVRAEGTLAQVRLKGSGS